MGTAAACRLTGRSRATHYRRLNPPPAEEPAPRPSPASALSGRTRPGSGLLNRPEYAELPPAQVWARELDDGPLLVLRVRTMYRILSAAGQNGERRRQATHPAKTVPELVATAPCQVFSWDITKLGGPDKGEWYHLYVIIDIFSRYISAGPSRRPNPPSAPKS